MTKRDFLRLLIKTSALYMLITNIFNISWIAMTPQIPYIDIVMTFIYIILLAILFWLINHYTDAIINFLKLDRHFDDDQIVIGNFNLQGIFTVAVVCIGGYLIVNQIFDFCYYCILAFKEKVAAHSSTESLYPITNYYRKWITSGASVILGYALLTNAKRIGSWLYQQNK
ncbi:hypothetical protein NBRC110019_15790 [Neptunitalea chrysea]|uniref:Uncharacterized protein n=1 Tax=Neptunitalea chrysea TaxID=1647581 RepID=A0A9W6B4R5_9FLAO|nr:hypothetical protein [Neptunitalea chrysea]GLB52539.1 hypothetical protein NBRC110019_15790 [Neptunitalea chrysea]